MRGAISLLMFVIAPAVTFGCGGGDDGNAAGGNGGSGGTPSDAAVDPTGDVDAASEVGNDAPGSDVFPDAPAEADAELDGDHGSCTGGPGAGDDCGPQGDESCCAARGVPGGTFLRSYDNLTPGHLDPSFPATVSDFTLDRFEVTVGRFRAFVDAYPASRPKPGDGAHPLIASSGWRSDWDASLPADAAELASQLDCTGTTWTDAAGANETKPVSCVSWWLAFAFCAWDGGRLPTEAEWNYAAAGGSDQRVFPWSTTKSAYIDPTLAVYQESTPMAVGSKSPQGDAKWGHADLAGNVDEWVLDSYADPYTVTCHDCANLADNGWRVLRGGSFGIPVDYLETSVRGSSVPTDTSQYFGFRCAR